MTLEEAYAAEQAAYFAYLKVQNDEHGASRKIPEARQKWYLAIQARAELGDLDAVREMLRAKGQAAAERRKR